MTATLTEPIRSHEAGSGTHTLTRVGTYEQAEELVDRLSDAGFPIERVRIVGVDLYSVEQVTGRMTVGRAALAGAATGAGFGLLVGLLFGVFSLSAGWPLMLLGGSLVGLLSGAALGAVAQWATGGRRDFSSVRNLRAHRYAVEVEPAHADDARHILGLPWPERQ
jgi:hypothetical protein